MLRSLCTRHLYLPLSHRLQGEPFSARLAHLEQTQWWQPEVLRGMQWEALQDTLRLAWEHLPFYRRHWNDACPGDVRSWEDFARLPLLTKEQVRDHFEELVWKGADWSVIQSETSGSTGMPLRVCHGREFRARHEAGQWRHRGWYGLQPGAPMLAVWGRPVKSRLDRWVLGLKNGLNNILHLSAFDLGGWRGEQLLDRVRRFRPRFVYAYPSALEELLRDGGEGLDELGVRLVACTAEPLLDSQAERFRKVFACPVADVYGCAEFGAFVHQCPQGGMHVAVENVLLEHLREARDGPAEAVVTSLFNPVMPLIRYRTGDLVTPLEEPCPCGRRLARVGVRAGRLGQMVEGPLGRRFHTEVFGYLGKWLARRGLKLQFRIIQLASDDFLVQVVSSERANWQELFADGLRDTLGCEVRVQIEQREALERLPSGKLTFFEARLTGR